MSATYNLHQSLGYQLTFTSRLTERRFEDALKTLKLTRITWCILLAVEGGNLPNPSDISAFVGINRTATSRALRTMERDGLISRCDGRDDGQGDGRTTRVTLTDKGRNLLARAVPMARENAQHYQNKLTPDENTQLHRILTKLQSGETAALKQL